MRKNSNSKVLSLVLVCFVYGSCSTNLNQVTEEQYYRSSADIRPRAQRADPVEVEDHEEDVEESEELAVLIRRPPASSGGLDGDAAGQVLFENRECLSRCYTSLDSDRVGQGVVYAVLDVESNGHVDGVLIGHSDVRSAPFLECLDRELSDLEMPRSSERSAVQVYFVFGTVDIAHARQFLRDYRERRDGEEGSDTVALSEIGTSVRGCYERIFRSQRTEPGRVVLDLTLTESGEISDIGISEDDFDGRLDECIQTVVEKLRFDMTEEISTSFSYPVIIYPSRQNPVTDSDVSER